MRSARLARPLLPLALVLPLLLLGAAGCGATNDSVSSGPTVVGSDQSSPSDGPASTAATSTDPTSDPTKAGPASPASEPHTSIAAQLSGASAKVHAGPADSAKVITTLGSSTALGSKTTLLVVEQRDHWVQVRLPIRPNGSTGWIKATEVTLRANPMAIHVDRAAHSLSLTRGAETVLETKVAVGSATNPTPAGDYYVTDLVDTDAPNGAYGPFAFGLSGHSDTLTEFGGGDGQLGVHGTNDPSSIGQSVSHGCVRVPNAIIRQLIDLVPLGTPVIVV